MVFLALMLAGSAPAAPSHDLLIRPAVGIANVRLGMTLAQVRGAWGAPQAVTRPSRRSWSAQAARDLYGSPIPSCGDGSAVCERCGVDRSA